MFGSSSNSTCNHCYRQYTPTYKGRFQLYCCKSCRLAAYKEERKLEKEYKQQQKEGK